MTKREFVDTAAWLALVNKSDNAHQKAREVRDDLMKLQMHFVTTDYVLLEVANALCRIPFRTRQFCYLSSLCCLCFLGLNTITR